MINCLEEWKPISKYPEYQISTLGRCRNPEGRIVTPRPGGYKKMYLRYQFYGKDMYAHRIVLEAFVGVCPDGMQCSHKDGNSRNNKLSNLEWTTPLLNSHQKIRHGTSGRGEKNACAKLKERDVIEVIARYLLGDPASEIAEHFGVDRGSIIHVVARKTWRHVPVSRQVEKALAIKRAENIEKARNESIARRKEQSRKRKTCAA